MSGSNGVILNGTGTIGAFQVGLNETKPSVSGIRQIGSSVVTDLYDWPLE